MVKIIAVLLVISCLAGCSQKAYKTTADKTSKIHSSQQRTLHSISAGEDRRFRWDVKTLQDRNADWLSTRGMPWQHHRTLSELVSWDAPDSLSAHMGRYSNSKGYNDESNFV